MFIFKRQRLTFCLLALLTALLCIAATPPPILSHQPPQNRPASAETLEQQGRSHYETGQFTTAAAAFEQAAEAYSAQGERLNQAIALSNLALTEQQLGRWHQANQAISDSLTLLAAKLEGVEVQRQQAILAQTLDVQGTLQLGQGNGQAAFETWEQAIRLYEQLGDRVRATRSQVNQAQALQLLGLYRRAITTLVAALGWPPQAIADLESLQPQLQTVAESPTGMAALQNLGEALRVTGNLELAEAVLQQSLNIAQRLQLPGAIATTQFKLGNLVRTQALVALSRSNLTTEAAAELLRKAQQGDRRLGIEPAEQFEQAMHRALELYGDALVGSTSDSTRLQAQLNQLRVLAETERGAAVVQRLPGVQQQIDRLPAGRTAIDARINLALSLMKLNRGPAPSLSSPAIAEILATAIQQARELPDPGAESYALGYLGELYERAGQLEDAQTTTRQALLLAQTTDAPEIAYRWQWQLGRVLNAQAERAGANRAAIAAEAIAAYTGAIDTLQSIRGDLIAVTPQEQLSFRDTIEPIYRQLVTLLLSAQQDSPGSQNLQAARNVIESLQLAELDNFFRAACLNGDPTLIDQIDPSAAIFYPIILPDRLAVIVSFPSQTPSQADSQSNPQRQTLRYYTTSISQEEITATVNLLRDALDQPNDRRFLPPAQQLYNWLIRPVADQLQVSSVNTLVFVLDGVLRNIPMAVLHDGQQYLVEKPYSIALTPGLRLLGSRPLAQGQLQSALLAGMTESRPGFSALPRVKDELAQIQAEIPHTTTLLDRNPLPHNEPLNVDGEFTSTNFQTAIEATPFPIVHLATHGQFSSQLEDTYILTEDGRLTIEDLKDSLQTTALRQDGVLELLVLSACETAAGDDQAALGLAGMAVRAGARSTVATLWRVNDDSSAVFMGQFYRELAQAETQQITKAEALHRAQRSLLHQADYQHPFFWAPYILLGNWR